MRRITIVVARALVYTVAAVLLLLVFAIVAIQTGWAKNQIRQLIVRQANQYLTATLEIGRLEGSLFRGLELGDVRLTRDGETIVSVDDVSLRYSIRELFESGVVIREIRLIRPRVNAAKQPDGRWNLSALIRSQARRNRTSGPGRPIHILSIHIADGDIVLRDPLTYGSVRVPSRFDRLDVDASFEYVPVDWRATIARASWLGESDLPMQELTGAVGNGRDGWVFDDLSVRTTRSAFVLSGRVERGERPTVLDLRAVAERFAFQEWGRVLPALRNIAINSGFDLKLKGPLDRLATELKLQSDGGSIQGGFHLNTRVPGWHGNGRVTVLRLNLARWLNRQDRPSDISGRVEFDLDLDLGRHFPRGSYVFEGPHADYLGYKADAVRARGTLTARDALISEASGVAYGSSFRLSAGSIGIDAPYAFRFTGTSTGLDLRYVPPQVPVPHVESVLALAFDVTGQFGQRSYIKGDATFDRSVFLDAVIASGAIGSIDTSTIPASYSGEGDVSNVDMGRFGAGLDVAWMLDPRYTGTIAGHFQVRGAGSDPATMMLTGGGRLTRATMFNGEMIDADVTVEIADGSLGGSYNGGLSRINPEMAFADPRFRASLTGTGNARFSVRDLLVRATTLEDYNVDGSLELHDSTVNEFAIDRGSVTGTLAGTSLTIGDLQLVGPALEGRGNGRLEFDGQSGSEFDYDISRADLESVQATLGQPISGHLVTKGRLSGPFSSLHLTGDATVSDFEASGVTALTVAGEYDATIPSEEPRRAKASVNGRATFVNVFNQQIPEATGTIAYDNQRIDFDLELSRAEVSRTTGSVVVDTERRSAALSALTLNVGMTTWGLLPGDSPATLSWTGDSVTISPVTFADTLNPEQQIGVSGTWRDAGNSDVKVTARRVVLDTFFGGTPARYGGTVDLDANIRGTREAPIVTGMVTVSDGRVRRLGYEKLSGRVDYSNGLFQVDLRLDQAPGVWLTAAGTVPAALFDKTLGEAPIDVQVASSRIGLGLLEGITTRVRDVTGEIEANVNVVGTTADPHFEGTVDVSNAGFVVTGTGARYRRGNANLLLARDRIDVAAFHLEDRNGRTLDVSGTLGTHELKVADVLIDIRARRFEVLNNETGNIEVNAALRLRGEMERPTIEGDVTIVSGELNIDEILAQALFQPYATQPTVPEAPDAISVLNPWDRLHLDITLHSPGTLQMRGQDVEVAANQLGLGSFNLRAAGDLVIRKDEGQPVMVNGSFDSVTGSYTFQGRRFDIDPSSRITFRGDLNPEVFITVTRVISSVETRVTISGSLRTPELQLMSTPPLESTDILSLIVFNATMNDLSAAQQRDLAVRAGALAAGFAATPLIGAIQRSLGLDILEIEAPNTASAGARVTVGNEIAPGLVAEFTRQFGQETYNEAAVEYYLSRILRIRATFSDAESLIARSPFRRVERAGIDLIVFFSF
jgi:autotransporter translocation and assembly factor TamB